MSKPQVEQAIDAGEIKIENIDENNLEPASYDARLGKEAIVTREIQLEDLKEKVEMGTAKKINVQKEKSISIPAGGLALVTTFEKFSLSNTYVGHIGMKSYYVRKGLGLLSGLQIDPGFGNPSAVLVLALKNQSTRGITLDFKDDICTIEFHELNEPAPEYENPEIEEQQSEGGIPKSDIDYMRTIEAMSVSEMTESLLTLSRSVENTNRLVKWLILPLAIGISVTLIGVVVAALV